MLLPESDEKGAVAVSVSTKVEIPSDEEKELVRWLKVVVSSEQK